MNPEGFHLRLILKGGYWREMTETYLESGRKRRAHRTLRRRIVRPFRSHPPSPGDAARDRTLSVVTLNMAKENDPVTVAESIRSAPRLRDADVFLLQEVTTGASDTSAIEDAARSLGYFTHFQPAAPGVYDQGLAVVSRYPLGDIEVNRLKACDLRFRERFRFAVSATVRTPWGDLRVWNVHLDTRINATERLEQLQPVIDAASRRTGPRLIAGDLNTNELYWLGSVVPIPGGPSHRDAIRNAMKSHGFEMPLPGTLNTFPAFRRHLDWIFVRDMQSLAASVEPVPFSDHNAIWARVGL